MQTKILLIILVISFGFYSVSAQPISKLVPSQVEWRVGDTTVFLKSAVKGVQQPDSISLIMYFEKTLKEISQEKLPKFEFQWYRYSPTKRYFEKTEIGKLVRRNPNAGRYDIVVSSMKDLKPGWWEVQVVSYIDNGYITFRNKNKFQILIKR